MKKKVEYIKHNISKKKKSRIKTLKKLIRIISVKYESHT